MTQKIVINDCFGGFGLSPEATLELYKRRPVLISATPVEQYFQHAFRSKDEELRIWRGRASTTESTLFMAVFDPEEKFVLYARDMPRDAPELVQLLEEWGSEKVSGSCGQLKIVEIPDGVAWEIEEYDGLEHVAEVHKTWS